MLQLQRTPKRGPYTKFTVQKAEIGKRAAEHGVAPTIHYYDNGHGYQASLVCKMYFSETFQHDQFAKTWSLKNLVLYNTSIHCLHTTCQCCHEIKIVHRYIYRPFSVNSHTCMSSGYQATSLLSVCKTWVRLHCITQSIQSNYAILYGERYGCQ